MLISVLDQISVSILIGFSCIFVLCVFVLINVCCKEEGLGTDTLQTKDPHKVNDINGIDERLNSMG